MDRPLIPAPVRNLDLRPLPDDPERLIVLDRLGLQPDPLAVPVVFFAVAQYFDGRHSAEELSEMLARQGVRVDAGSIEAIASQLGEAYLLDDHRTRTRIEELERELLAGPRPARLAGSCYPADTESCRRWIEDLMQQAGPPAPERAEPLPALVLPHIDPRLGGVTYARGYRELLAAPLSDVYVILGIGHAGLRHGISLAPVDFQTPLGTAPVDKAICDELIARCGPWITSDQLVQAQEHSIECQVIFLAHLMRHPFTIVPLLTSFGQGDTDRMLGVLATLRTVLRESGKSFTVLASVDFSHVGPMYGDHHPAAPIMWMVEAQDRGAIERLEAADDAGFWKAIHQRQNPTRICGYSSMWSMLHLVEPRRGRLLEYAETTMDDQDSRVTFASMTFE